MKKNQIQIDQEIQIHERALNELWQQMRADPEFWAYEMLNKLSQKQIIELARLNFDAENDSRLEVIPKVKKPEKPKMEVLDF